MKIYLTFAYISLILLLFLSCNEAEDDVIDLPDCIEVQEKANWIKKSFNSNYTIMYPDMYDPSSEYLLPWSKFVIRREDEKVVIEGGFCDPTALPCHVWDYYGESLDTEKDSIKHNSTNNTYLNIKKAFCQDEIIIAYFYYTESMPGDFRNAYGKLFLIDNNDSTYRSAGYVSFAKSEQQEILDILGTLHYE